MIVKHVSADCRHCSLPVPAGLIVANRDEQFCCNGCETAYHLISSSGLDAFYKMVDSSSEDQTLRDRKDPLQRFDELGDANFLSRFAHPLPNGLMEIRLGLEGIHCAACVWLVEKLPALVPGVILSQVNWSSATLRLRWAPDQTTLPAIASVLYRLGYTPHPIRTSEKALRRQIENRQHLARIGMAGAAAGNNMLISAALYLGMFTHIEAPMIGLLRWVSCLIGVASLLGPGRVFLRSGWAALKTWTPHMDLPISLGLLAGTINGLANTIRGSGEIYFDSLTVLIFLLLIGRWIQFRQQNRAADAVELLYRLTPQRARRIADGGVTEVMIEDVEVGDRLEIRPGDLIPTDAKIVEGNTEIDESLLTGESKPAAKKIGDAVSAGTRNILSPLVVQATAIGQETRIGKIVELVEQASSQRPKIVQWANQIGGYFVVMVMLLALVTFAIWFRTDVNLATDHAIALLVIACPCALAMATPLAISVALGRLAKQRIMVKSGDVMQSLSRPGMIWLDKTGTLTEGNMQVLQWHGDPSWIPWVAAAEKKFSHPVAMALVQYGETTSEQDAQPPTQTPEPILVSEQVALPNGVAAVVNGHSLVIGNRTALEGELRKLESKPSRRTETSDLRPMDWESIELQILSAGNSPCWIAVDGEVVAIASLGDRIRPDAALTLDSLRRRGWSVGILSGDHPLVAQEVARTLNIQNVHAGVSPEDKLAIVNESNRQFSTTVMVGDGVNDSAALAAATVGIAVHNGAEASLAAAPVYLGESGLKPLSALLAASQTTCSTIRKNLAASLGYNVIGVGLAMAGVLHPLLAAVLMPVSSLTVIAISLRAGLAKER